LSFDSSDGRPSKTTLCRPRFLYFWHRSFFFLAEVPGTFAGPWVSQPAAPTSPSNLSPTLGPLSYVKATSRRKSSDIFIHVSTRTWLLLGACVSLASNLSFFPCAVRRTPESHRRAFPATSANVPVAPRTRTRTRPDSDHSHVGIRCDHTHMRSRRSGSDSELRADLSAAFLLFRPSALCSGLAISLSLCFPEITLVARSSGVTARFEKWTTGYGIEPLAKDLQK
jgi:hypothetical protein